MVYTHSLDARERDMQRKKRMPKCILLLLLHLVFLINSVVHQFGFVKVISTHINNSSNSFTFLSFSIWQMDSSSYYVMHFCVSFAAQRKKIKQSKNEEKETNEREKRVVGAWVPGVCKRLRASNLQYISYIIYIYIYVCTYSI